MEIKKKSKIKKLIVTAKSVAMENSYTFKVDKSMNKNSILEYFKKNAIDVLKINIVNIKSKNITFKRKSGKKSGYKKAYIKFSKESYEKIGDLY